MPDSKNCWGRLAERYSKRPVPNEEAYRKKLKITQGHLSSVMDIMEFGCGTDTAPLIHAPFVRHVHAIDISEKMIEIAKGEAAFSCRTPVVLATA